MKKPYVICHMMTSVDGRIDCAMTEHLPGVAEYYDTLDALGEFAPKFAELNDDVLFGQVWSREDKLSLRDRSLVTVVALMAQGLTDESFRYHLLSAKKNGITKDEIAEIVTHAAFYCGWPKAWAVFRMAKEIWKEEEA